MIFLAEISLGSEPENSLRNLSLRVSSCSRGGYLESRDYWMVFEVSLLRTKGYSMSIFCSSLCAYEKMVMAWY